MIRISLDKIMKAEGWDQKYVIEKTGLNRNTVKSLVANASTRIDFPTLNALCKNLGLTPSQIIEYTPDKEE
ncbi:helix-turn-helix transcriptional regulator [Brevibacillus formosus]|uniref:XRE family transcriptional regulator n=1 Tax=Brevibacillus formosus TaxID=54913 RepID=A0A837KKG1_9BACL|nr:helix-turn-helix transcriptional regulator [Brevibacillus formosus]KLH96769.1 XRE family transcriptional regulator [Brevibacillus formosus]MED1955196.1 helix-turn-helix transcriptional regulator [Brevibacillus formosus]PSJ94929.1 XRE family transcriptional regulator [Brevibacillus formosus]GED58441.1 hypothetical protein BFO01nite_25730 [Brevibacillus formosus]